jgi:hypothetical protein
MPTMKKKILLLILLFATPLWAHQPKILEEDMVINHPDVSHALYGVFTEETPHFKVRMSFSHPFAMPFEVLVPHRDELTDFRPAFAIISPGLPQPTSDGLAALEAQGIEIPSGSGAYVHLNDEAERMVIFESFTRRVFWSTGPVAIPLGAGASEIHLWVQDGQYGPATLGFGVEEDFSEGFGEVFADWDKYAY